MIDTFLVYLYISGLFIHPRFVYTSHVYLYISGLFVNSHEPGTGNEILAGHMNLMHCVEILFCDPWEEIQARMEVSECSERDRHQTKKDSYFCRD